MKTLIYIPAYCAAKTLPKVFERIPAVVKASVDEILVVDNFSSDDTSDVVRRYQALPGWEKLKLLRNEVNEGYGGSQKRAYQYAIEHSFDTVAMLHGDAQYAPEYLESLMSPVQSGKYDLVFGSRMTGNPLKGGMPIIRFLGNRFLTTVQNIFLSQNLSEYHSGYRVYSVAALKKIPLLRMASDYHFDTEIIILFAHFKFRIGEFSIPTHYGDEKNYVNVWKYGTDVLVSTLTFWAHKMGLRRSRGWSKILVDSEKPMLNQMPKPKVTEKVTDNH